MDRRVRDELAGVVVRLSQQFEGIYSQKTIEAMVGECYDQLAASATVTGFLPILVERLAKDRLSAQAHVEGRRFTRTPQVLFLCVHNAGRSQMAAAWLHHLSDGTVSVRSAGSNPSGQINPVVVEAMAEVGVELKDAFPKPMTDDIVRASDVVVTMGCGDACPVYPGKRYLDWEIPDPAGRPIEEVRIIRDQISELVRGLLDGLATR